MDIFFVLSSVRFFGFSRASLRVNGQIIHVDRKPSLGYLFTKYGVHHHLEGRWRVRESEEHDCWFEESFRGQECCFRFVTWFDAYIVIPPSNVKLCEEGASTQPVACLGNEMGNVAFSFGPFIYRSVVLDGSELSIFLLYEKEVGGVGAPRLADRSPL